MSNKCNLTNCPHTPARFLSPVPPQRGGGKDKRHPDKQEKKPQLNSKRGRKSTVTRSSKHDWCKGQRHQPQAGIALGESRSSAARRAEQGARQGSILDCTWKSTPAPPSSVSLSSPSHGNTPRVPCSCRGEAELKLRPTLLHKRHQQQSPAQEPPWRTVWGQRCHYCSPAKPSLQCGTPKRSPVRWQ